VLHGSSRRLTLPEFANVIISDIRGSLPLMGDAVASIEDARMRFLAPSGVMIPAVDTIYAAIASVPQYYDSLISPWRDSDTVVLSPLLARVLNSPYSVNFESEKLVSAPVKWCELDYRSRASGHVTGKFQLQASADVVAHGIC